MITLISIPSQNDYASSSASVVLTPFSSCRSDKISTLRLDIAENERQQEMAQENFEKISRLIKKEVRREGKEEEEEMSLAAS